MKRSFFRLVAIQLFIFLFCVVALSDGPLASKSVPCFNTNGDYVLYQITSGDVISHGGPPQGSFNVGSSISGSSHIYYYNVSRNNTDVLSGAFNSAQSLGSFDASAGDIIRMDLRGQGCESGDFGTIFLE